MVLFGYYNIRLLIYYCKAIFGMDIGMPILNSRMNATHKLLCYCFAFPFIKENKNNRNNLGIYYFYSL